MPRFLVDEDLPRTLARDLGGAGIPAEDVRDIGLRGCTDEDIFERARSAGATILTGDTGFGNLLRFPLGTHSGIVVARFPNELPTERLNAEILNALQSLSDDDVKGNLVIIEPGRIRLRREP